MADRVEITDRESTEAWLQTQDHQTQVWFATRCTLRALPGLGKWEDETTSGLAFASCRAMLISAAAATCPVAEMKELSKAARSAASAASSAASARSAFSADSDFSAFSAAWAVNADRVASFDSDSVAWAASASVAFSAAWAAATADANAPSTWEKLWHEDIQPRDVAAAWETLKAQWNADGPHWDFWIEWYEAVRDGKWTNWDLIFEIATKVRDEDWDAGPARVAERIREIEAQYLSEHTKLHETIELNPETGKFRVVPAELQNPTLTSALLSRVEDCLDDALSGNNGLTQTSREVKTLRRTIEKYANDPQRMELDFTSVAVSLRRQIYETCELAASEDNIALLESTEEGARGLRANHPEIAENRNRLAQQALSEMSREDLEFLEEAQPVLVALSEAQMAEDFERDIPQLINDALSPLPSGAPPLPGADEATRIFYRTSKMASLYAAYRKGTKRGAEFFDSDTVKSIRLVGVCGGISVVLWNIIQIGLRAFGVM